MHFSNLLVLASLVVARTIPETSPVPSSLSERQLLGSIENELTLGPCRDVIFIFARGSTEIGNMGTVVGPGVASQLKSRLGSTRVAVEGVPYAAAIPPNYLPGGTDAASEAAMVALLNLADTKCPDSVIVTGGYSQGGAVNHRAIENLPQRIKDKIKAVVLFGDTQKRADGDAIPNYDGKIKFYCDGGLDQVCNGVLAAAVLPPHLSYGNVADEAGDWLADQL